MHKILSINFWVQLFLSTFLTMCMIYLIKKVTAKVEVPVVSEIAQNV